MLSVATAPKMDDHQAEDMPSLEHFVEALNSVSGADAEVLIEEIGAFERAGVVSSVLKDILQRAGCIASAERLLSKFG